MRNSAPLLTGHFRDFCADLEGLLQAAKRENPAPPEELRLSAIDLIEKRVLDLARAERFAPGREAEFRYALAAFTDECFLEFEWIGRESWRAELVETRLFGSRAAGQRVFDRIDGLLASETPARAAMAAVYLLMLGLGFRGRFRAAAPAPEIERRRAALWAWLERKSPGLLADGKRVAPQAYGHTVEEGVLVQLPTPARWWALAGLVVFLWLGASFHIWSRLAADLTTRIDAVEQRVEASRHRLAADGGRR
jgi:type VI secretion system protein ImpK